MTRTTQREEVGENWLLLLRLDGRAGQRPEKEHHQVLLLLLLPSHDKYPERFGAENNNNNPRRSPTLRLDYFGRDVSTAERCGT